LWFPTAGGEPFLFFVGCQKRGGRTIVLLLHLVLLFLYLSLDFRKQKQNNHSSFVDTTRGGG